ncbi:hypothetical protein [Photobacterium leiognathi]|uniref:hypothetical protein n=1 Tax=Photobacterium leiognathi TaxID=553611 RepID=UPI000D154EA9|nr:hypothetical protein [Photobacterium leiognathi]PSW43800.1 hypothetical protein C0W40_11925 [Photobacterium leiognathi subsp. mandapamensis]
MATVENENQGWNDQNLNKLFSTIDVNKIREPFNKYLDSLDALYTEYQAHSSCSTFHYYKRFVAESRTKEEAQFDLKALSFSNHDESSLENENVILFQEPVIVSELRCSGYPHDENSGALSLISYKGFEKKFIIKRSTALLNNESVTTYKVHETVLGIILPKYVNLKSVKFTTYNGLLKEPKKLEAISKALDNSQELPSVEIQNIIKKFSDINMMIKSSNEKIDSVQADIHLLEQERLHNENAITNTQKALTKVQKDHDKVSLSYQKISNELSEKEDQIEDIESKIKASQKLYEEEEQRLKSIKEELTQNSDDLANTKELLAKARKEQNATSFDTAGHTAETKTQLNAYYKFAFITFIGLACMAVYVYKNGQNFSNTLPYLVHVSAWDILLSRLPLVTATTLIIGGLSGVFFYLIKHIVSLNTEKMTMLKAGILAEQITNSLDCKKMTEDEILEFKRDTKIKLIMQVFTKNEADKDINNLIIEALKAINSK